MKKQISCCLLVHEASDDSAETNVNTEINMTLTNQPIHQGPRLSNSPSNALSVFVVLLVALAPVTVTSFNSSDLLFIDEVQDAFCTPASRCTPVPNVTSHHSVYDLPVLPPFLPDPRCCEPCSCNRPTCGVEGTCCPDILDELTSQEESTSAVQVTCEYPHLRPGLGPVTPRAEIAYKMYRKCPNEYALHAGTDKMSAKLVVSKCEHNDDFTDIESKIPVTSRETLKTYQNQYCAYCHGVSHSELIRWQAVVKCGAKSSVLPTSIATLVFDILRTAWCNMIYNPPLSLPGLGRSQCRHAPFNACNITGGWETYDPVVEAGCHAYTSVFGYIYRNVFCYLCNTPWSGPPFDTVTCAEPAQPPFHVAFSFLLKLNSHDEKEVSQHSSKFANCASTQVYDSFKETCRDISCRRPWILVDKQCVNMLDNAIGILYELFLKLQPIDASIDYSDMDRDSSVLEHYIIGMFQELNVSKDLYGFAIYKGNLIQHRPNTELSSHYYFAAHISVLSTITHPLESNVVNDLLSLHKSEVTVQTNSGLADIYAASLGVYEVHDGKRSCLLDVSGNIMLELVMNYTRRISISDGVIITLSPMHTCPFFTLGVDEFDMTITPTGISSEVIQSRWTNDEYIIENGRILICMDVYMQSITDHQNGLDGQGTNAHVAHITWKGVLSFSCTCISVLCACLSLLTYSLFKSLRTQPGVNNMGLLISLIIAQLLFVFGIGQAIDRVSVLCKVIGILVHFSWLLVTFWMNVCSFHVFKVFRSNTKCDSASLSITAGYCMYCFVGSSIPVIINVLVSLIRFGFTSGNIGYGGQDCYISTQEMVIYVFAIPVGVLVLVNIAFFIAVVVKITKTSPVVGDSRVKARRNYLKIYAKLSSLTGTTWVFGIVYSFTDIEVFEYVFIILTAGHGLFIFVSFSCNNRVWQQYKAIINKYIRVHSKWSVTNQSSMNPNQAQGLDSRKHPMRNGENVYMSPRKPNWNRNKDARKLSEQTGETNVSF